MQFNFHCHCEQFITCPLYCQLFNYLYSKKTIHIYSFAATPATNRFIEYTKKPKTIQYNTDRTWSSWSRMDHGCQFHCFWTTDKDNEANTKMNQKLITALIFFDNMWATFIIRNQNLIVAIKHSSNKTYFTLCANSDYNSRSCWLLEANHKWLWLRLEG